MEPSLGPRNLRLSSLLPLHDSQYMRLRTEWGNAPLGNGAGLVAYYSHRADETPLQNLPCKGLIPGLFPCSLPPSLSLPLGEQVRAC